MRAVADLEKLGPRTVWVDCDVIEADGGTRTAAITGGFVALRLAVKRLLEEEKIEADPLSASVAAVSVGIVEGTPLLDLCYTEDFAAEVDMNVVMTSKGEFIEVQGTAESRPFSDASLDRMLALAHKGIRQLVRAQKQALSGR
jgi:ribonuclease PH